MFHIKFEHKDLKQEHEIHDVLSYAISTDGILQVMFQGEKEPRELAALNNNGEWFLKEAARDRDRALYYGVFIHNGF